MKGEKFLLYVQAQATKNEKRCQDPFSIFFHPEGRSEFQSFFQEWRDPDDLSFPVDEGMKSLSRH